MPDTRFFKSAGPFSLDQLAQISGSEIGGNVQKGIMYSDIMPLAMASEYDVSFIDNPRYIKDLMATHAGAILISSDRISKAPSGAALLVMKEPYLGFARLTQAFYPIERSDEGKINAGANIDSSAEIGKGVNIEAGVVIGSSSEIDENSSIGANSVIGAGVIVGKNCKIGPNVTLAYCKMGDNNIIHSGARIGQDGFGFAASKEGHVKVFQLGRVIIGNDVEIGANTTIDRGSGPDTTIGDGTKIDNLVHIAHNVQIGKGCFITAQNGISGSVVVGDFVYFGGQAGVSGHVNIGDGVKVAAQSGVSTSIKAGKTVAGTPAQSARDHWKGLALLRRIVKENRGK